MSFHHVRINDCVNTRIVGGPRRKTTIVEYASGVEHRNTSWADSRRQYTVNYNNRDSRELEQLLAFFEVHGGRLIGFQYKDWADYKSCPVKDTPTNVDQIIGIGDGTTRVFQLTKTYEVGALSYVRDIVLPVNGTVIVAVDGEHACGVLLPNGLVMLSDVPPNNAVITAGFEFDVPVRFDNDELDFLLENPHKGSAQRIGFTELKRPLTSIVVADYDYIIPWMEAYCPAYVVHWSNLIHVLVNVTWPEYF